MDISTDFCDECREKIRAMQTNHAWISVDVPEDLIHVEKMWGTMLFRKVVEYVNEKLDGSRVRFKGE